MFFGDKVAPIVINNLPAHSIVVIIAKVALVFDLFFTFVVVILPSRDIVEASLGLHSASSHWKKCVVRTLLCALTLGLAVAIPDISDLINLVSGISLSFNTFIFPPLVYLKLDWISIKIGEKKFRPLVWLLFILILLFGCGAAVVTTIQAVQQVISDF